MRGKAIGSEWYKNDRKNGNKVFIQVEQVNINNPQKDIDTIYKLISSSKSGFLEYIYIVKNNDMFNVVAKFKDKYAAEQKARLRKAFFDWNKSNLNTVENIQCLVEKVRELSTYGNLIFIKGVAFSKELKLDEDTPISVKNILEKKRDELKFDFIDFMKKYNLMILENTNIFVDGSYKHITYDDMVDLLCKENFFTKYKLSTIEKFYKNIQKEQGLISSYHRRDFPIYRPRRRYLEFADCVYDTFTLKRMSKNQEITESNTIRPVHPCYKFDKTFIYYSQRVPYQYFIQVAKLMEPEMFEWIFNQFTNEFIPKENCTIISCPRKTNIFKPLTDVYDNVIYKVDETNATCFDMSNCLDKEILFTQNINPLESFKKNVIFKNKHVLDAITDGKSFETPIKYKKPQVCTSKIVMSITDIEILYIPPWLSDKILGVEFPKESIFLSDDEEKEDIEKYIISDADEYSDEHIGGCIIASMMVNKDEIKKFIKDKRYENDWNKPIKVNGKIWPNITHTFDIEKPKTHEYTIRGYEKSKSLNRII